ncbi:hypothetical protein ACOZZ3_002972 [Cronobacter dublinensis]
MSDQRLFLWLRAHTLYKTVTHEVMMPDGSTGYLPHGDGETDR